MKEDKFTGTGECWETADWEDPPVDFISYKGNFSNGLLVKGVDLWSSGEVGFVGIMNTNGKTYYTGHKFNDDKTILPFYYDIHKGRRGSYYSFWTGTEFKRCEDDRD